MGAMMKKTLRNQSHFLWVFLLLWVLAPVCYAANDMNYWQAPPKQQCQRLQRTIQKAMPSGLKISSEHSAFEDYISLKSGMACQIKVNGGTGVIFPGTYAIMKRLKKALLAKGWREDINATADGPMGSTRRLTKGKAIAIISVHWYPVKGVHCPKDQPIAACHLKPSLKRYQITLYFSEH